MITIANTSFTDIGIQMILYINVIYIGLKITNLLKNRDAIRSYGIKIISIYSRLAYFLGLMFNAAIMRMPVFTTYGPNIFSKSRNTIKILSVYNKQEDITRLFEYYMNWFWVNTANADDIIYETDYLSIYYLHEFLNNHVASSNDVIYITYIDTNHMKSPYNGQNIQDNISIIEVNLNEMTVKPNNTQKPLPILFNALTLLAE